MESIATDCRNLNYWQRAVGKLPTLSSSGSLQRNVAVFCQPVNPVSASASLQLAAERIRTFGTPILPIVENGVIKGVVDGRLLTSALAGGFDPSARVDVLPPTEVPMIFASAPGAEALRVFEETRAQAALVVDRDYNLVGVLTPAHLFPASEFSFRPMVVGGMATPVSVYLTNGSTSGGATTWHLILAGMLLGLLHLGADAASMGLEAGLTALHAPVNVINAVVGPASVLLFLIGLRQVPMAGYHAAEHMVVHAIERGEELHPDIVRRMPRVHPRCGTNLAAGMGLFFGIAFAPFPIDPELKILAAALVTIFGWKSIGSFLQLYFTTRPPNKRQIEAGIRAGKELLTRYESDPVVAPSGWIRFAKSGLPLILVGYISLIFLIDLASQWLNFGPLLRVS